VVRGGNITRKEKNGDDLERILQGKDILNLGSAIWLRIGGKGESGKADCGGNG